MNNASLTAFDKFFEEGDVGGARSFLEAHKDAVQHEGYTARSLLRQFVDQNGGRCDSRAQLQIADLLTLPLVRSFRDAVVNDTLDEAKQQIQANPGLVFAEFTAGRGIAQAIHHWRSIALAELLLDSGADIDARTTVHDIGDTALSLKLREGDIAACEFLLQRGANPNLGILKHMPSDEMKVLIPLLLNHGWDINESVQNVTLLHHDAKHGHGNRMSVLLEHGANPNLADSSGQTALHIIAARGVGTAAIRALVAAGAQLDSKDRTGKTPLDLARSAPGRTAEKDLEALIAAQR